MIWVGAYDKIKAFGYSPHQKSQYTTEGSPINTLYKLGKPPMRVCREKECTHTIPGSLDLETQLEISFRVSFFTTLMEAMRGCLVTSSPVIICVCVCVCVDMIYVPQVHASILHEYIHNTQIHKKQQRLKQDTNTIYMYDNRHVHTSRY